ncbi:hypothetical protein GN956_G3955 [Arapaima gigas]
MPPEVLWLAGQLEVFSFCWLDWLPWSPQRTPFISELLCREGVLCSTSWVSGCAQFKAPKSQTINPQVDHV